MIIKFSMDRIKNMDQIYTWTPIHSEDFGCDGTEEHYHGDDYCKRVVTDTLKVLNWGTQEYLGTLERIAKEVFNISTADNYPNTQGFRDSFFSGYLGNRFIVWWKHPPEECIL